MATGGSTTQAGEDTPERGQGVLGVGPASWQLASFLQQKSGSIPSSAKFVDRHLRFIVNMSSRTRNS